MPEFDYDLRACLEHNPQKDFTLEDIECVLAVWEGQNDGDDWRWILLLKDANQSDEWGRWIPKEREKRYVYLVGGCDYTGWDCQSSASSTLFATPQEAVRAELSYKSFYESDSQTVVNSLAEQLEKGKGVTWREAKDVELAVASVPLIDPGTVKPNRKILVIDGLSEGLYAEFKYYALAQSVNVVDDIKHVLLLDVKQLVMLDEYADCFSTFARARIANWKKVGIDYVLAEKGKD